jgi:hypothetical protein
MKGLDRLRIALGMGLLGTAVLAATRSARAGTAPANGNVVAGDVTWTYRNDTAANGQAPFAGSCGGKLIANVQGRPNKPGPTPNGSGTTGCGLGLNEATLNVGTVGSRTDAFDGALVMAVNGTVFKNPDGSLDINGTTLTSDTVNIGGLNTQVQFFFEPTQDTVRAIYSFTNTTGATLPANVLIDNNLGSDSNTVVEGTADGDTTIEPGDSWFATSDQILTRGLAGDPPLTWVRYGQGAAVTANAQPFTTADGFHESYTLSVPAGATQRVMVFVKLNNTDVEALAAGPAMDSLEELQALGLLAGLGAPEQAQLINWGAAAVGGPARPVPSVSDWGKLALMLTLAVGGMAAVRLGNRSAKRAL